MKAKDRRVDRRVPVQILVKCLPAKLPGKRSGPDTTGWDMWTRDIGQDGVGLRWKRHWAHRNCAHCFHEIARMPCPGNDTCRCTHSPHAKRALRKGQTVHLSDLIYTEKGSKVLKGRIQWIRHGKFGDTYDVGIVITTPRHRHDFEALRQH